MRKGSCLVDKYVIIIIIRFIIVVVMIIIIIAYPWECIIILTWSGFICLHADTPHLKSINPY